MSEPQPIQKAQPAATLSPGAGVRFVHDHNSINTIGPDHPLRHAAICC